jgi:hypothetical protein
MAPITNTNLQSAKRLLKYCEIRHITSVDLETTIVDDNHLFRFKGTSVDQEVLGSTFSFQNAFYTSDLTYVKKTRSMFKDLWSRAYNLSEKKRHTNFKLPTKSEPDIESKRDLTTLPERLLKAAQTHKTLARAVIGTIIIAPPNHLNLPDIRILAMNFDKESAYGEGDMLRVDLSLNTPNGETFVPVAMVTDACPEIVAIQKAKYAGTPAGKNVIPVNPEQLQVWSKGKTLFAGWTISIPLLSLQQKLDAACILFEAFGDESHITTSHVLPSGWVMGTEWDRFQAFTTYIGTSWKYSGPGICGTVGKMIFIESAPKK